MLPNFLVVGAAKAGTTTLYDIFKRHNEIFVPRKKELNFFSAEYHKGLEYYIDYFKHANSFKAVGEVSPSYFWFKGTAKRIYNTIPNVKLILMLRNPIDRFYSDYRYSQIFGYNMKNIEHEFYNFDPKSIFNNNNNDWTDVKVMLRKGLYSKLLQEYLKFFNLNQFHIILFESLVSNYYEELNRLQKFLDVNVQEFGIIKKNAGGLPRSYLLLNTLNFKHPFKTKLAKIIGFERAGRLKNNLLRKNMKKGKIKINNKLKDFLIEFYRNDIVSLQSIINKDLSNWLT